MAAEGLLWELVVLGEGLSVEGFSDWRVDWRDLRTLVCLRGTRDGSVVLDRLRTLALVVVDCAERGTWYEVVAEMPCLLVSLFTFSLSSWVGAARCFRFM